MISIDALHDYANEWRDETNEKIERLIREQQRIHDELLQQLQQQSQRQIDDARSRHTERLQQFRHLSQQQTRAEEKLHTSLREDHRADFKKLREASGKLLVHQQTWLKETSSGFDKLLKASENLLAHQQAWVAESNSSQVSQDEKTSGSTIVSAALTLLALCIGALYVSEPEERTPAIMLQLACTAGLVALAAGIYLLLLGFNVIKVSHNL